MTHCHCFLTKLVGLYKLSHGFVCIFKVCFSIKERAFKKEFLSHPNHTFQVLRILLFTGVAREFVTMQQINQHPDGVIEILFSLPLIFGQD